MSYLDKLYTPPAVDNVNESAKDVTNENAFSNAKNWLQYNKYKVGGRALQALGALSAANGVKSLNNPVYKAASQNGNTIDMKPDYKPGAAQLAGGGLLALAGNKLMQKHKQNTTGIKGLINRIKMIDK